MKLKLALHRSGKPSVDLMATVDTGATVGDLAERIWRADPTVRDAAGGLLSGRPTLVVKGAVEAALDPAAKLFDSGLRSGMTVALTFAPEGYAAAHGEPVAVVTVVEPSGLTKEYQLRTRTGTIGRDRDCAVVLSDTLVSRQHVRFSIGARPEIADLASANGVEVNGSRVTRAEVRPDDVIQLGDTRLSIRALSTAASGAESASEGHIRSPRIEVRYAGTEFSAPEPPKRPEKPPFPIISIIAPFVVGLALFTVTRSVLTLLFVALSPLMMAGYAVETMLGGKRAYRKAVKQFRADLAELAAEAEEAAAQEAEGRRREHPSTVECVEAVRRRSPLLWTRRPDEPGFCEIRLGTGRQLSRSSVALSTQKDLPRDLMTQAAAVAHRFATVDAVPVLAQPAEHGAVGLAGPREPLLGAARALLAQTVALHSPAELVLTAFVAAEQSRDWDWLKWLPHTTSPHTPVAARHLASTVEDGIALVSALEDLLAQRSAEEAGPLPIVVALMEHGAPVEHSRVVQLAEHGWRHGIHVVWLAEDAGGLPAPCRTFVALRSTAPGGVAGFVHSGQTVEPLDVETLDAATATEIARRLAPLVDVGARIDDDSDLPRTVSLLAVAGPAVVPGPDYILESWLQNRSIVAGPRAPGVPARKSGTLRAVIGRTALGPHVLDLREDGPHALVGGTTGSGKSELLQAWILALAAAHSPQRLTFMLIDYKGGSAFKDLALLPHTVGNFTDLDPHLVRRALTSLRAELKKREKLFVQYQAKDLLELERKRVGDAPPSLVIVVDEFAALTKELPEFVDGVVDVAQRGRSLGVHLILATQRPAGVITDNLRANTNLRLALRTADEDDSTDVLGSPQAAFFDSAIPGRAVSKTGPGRLVAFQTGYAGGWTSQTPPPPEIVLEELRFGARVLWEPPETDQSHADLGATDIQRMIAAINLANRDAQIRPPERPWLPELASVYDLSRVPTARRDTELVFGVRDRPTLQDQPPIGFHPDAQGNLAVFGTGGSGKTVLLRTLAAAAGFTVRGGPCHVYGLDFGNGGLSMLADLPHVGAVIAGTDTDRTVRLLTWLSRLVTERGERYSRVGAGTITDYRTNAAAPDEPRILLMVDGLGAFRQAYESVDRLKYFDMFCQLAGDGRAVGLHVLVTADRPGSVPTGLASAIQTRVVLRLADQTDYSALDVPGDVLHPASPPGRGLLLDQELQVAVLGGAAEVRHQAAAMREYAEAIRKANPNMTPAEPVEGMPERVLLHTLPSAVDGRPVLGLDAATLTPAAFTPRGGFLVSGPPGSGRTTTLRALAQALHRFDPAIAMHLLSPSRRSELSDLPFWRTQALGVDDVTQTAQKLAQQLRSGGPEVVFIENVGEFATYQIDSSVSDTVADLVRACLDGDGFVVGEGETSTLTGRGGPLERLKRSRYGVALIPDPSDGDRVFGTEFPPKLPRAAFPPGRGLLVHSGRTPIVAVGWTGDPA